MLIKLLSEIVNDFDRLYRAYHQGGLISDGTHGEMARKLLGGGEDIARFRREFLLVDALLRNRVGSMLTSNNELQHLVVFGGNNVGKSTVVNILAGGCITSASPEGGHTRHAHAFWRGCKAEQSALFRDRPFAFRRLQKHGNGDLARAPLDRYGVSQLASDILPSNVVLWDTPDCDAVGSEQYLAAVIEAVATADLVIYVTTSEKAAVEHLVEWVLLLNNTGVQLLECLNRTRVRDQPTIIQSERKRYFPEAAKRLGLPVADPPVVGLKFMVEGDEEDLWDPEQHPEVNALRQRSFALLAESSRDRAAAQTVAFAIARLDRLLQPARMEVEAIKQWEANLAAGIDQFVEIYEREYLISDKVIEPISRLNAEILSRLNPNIPGLKEMMWALNWFVRWQSKLTIAVGGHIYRVGKRHWERLRRPAEDTQRTEKAPAEVIAYKDAHEFVLNELWNVIERARAAPQYHPFWDAVASAWNVEIEALNETFAELLEEHIEKTDRTIKQTAGDILDRLKQQPNLLKTLQGAKVAANMSGVAVSFAIPGVGSFIYDLLEEAILIPAMLGTVDAGTQAAVKTFVAIRKKTLISELKEDAARNAATLYGEPLKRIAQVAMTKAGTMGVDAKIFDRLPAALQQLQFELKPSIEDEHEPHSA